MSFIEIIFVGIALSMDAFAVSTAYGIARRKPDLRGATVLGVVFGGFQALMPMLGFYLSAWAGDYVKSVDHWIAFFLLSAIGTKMIYDAVFKRETESQLSELKIWTLFVLAVATSIDAFAVGISFVCMGVEIFKSSAIIGATTFLFSFFGAIIGAEMGGKLGKKSEIFGGAILIIIGLRVLLCAV